MYLLRKKMVQLVINAEETQYCSSPEFNAETGQMCPSLKAVFVI